MTHVHHWLIEPGKARDAQGSCECGAVRVFKGFEALGENSYRKGYGIAAGRPFDTDGVTERDMGHFRQSWYIE